MIRQAHSEMQVHAPLPFEFEWRRSFALSGHLKKGDIIRCSAVMAADVKEDMHVAYRLPRRGMGINIQGLGHGKTQQVFVESPGLFCISATESRVVGTRDGRHAGFGRDIGHQSLPKKIELLEKNYASRFAVFSCAF
jgi:hypothetical protein